MFANNLHRRPLISQQRPYFILATLIALGIFSIIALNTPTNPSYLIENSPIQQIELPLAFVANQGQTRPDIQFQAHDLGGTLYFAKTEVVLALQSVEKETASSIHLQFVGAEPDVALHEGNALPGVVNYLIGDQPSEWLTNIPTYGSIIYESLYPGIDLRYDGANGRLKGTYLVAPGANPSLIQWQHAGANSVTADAAGNLVITLPNAAATIQEAAPIAWQEIDGQKLNVPVSYAIGNNGAVGFTLGQYNPQLPLIIDPTIVYSVTLGGSDVEAGTGIALDSAGNSYITGFTSSDNYPTVNPYQTHETSFDVFVTKINAAGEGIVYSTYIGGDGMDTGSGITVDDNGIAYVVGDTDSTNFPTQNPVQASNGGSLIADDAFVLALNADGNDLVYSTYLGGSSFESAEAIALDGSGNVYVTGMTGSDDFPTHLAYDSTLGGVTDAFVAKLNSSGSAWVYSTYLGGSGEDLGFGITVDGDTAYVVGNTLSTDFPTENPYQANKDGPSDLFVTKINSAGTGLDYSTYLGGSAGDIGYGIAVHNGQAHVTGYTSSSDYPTQTPIQPSFGGGDEDAVVSVLSATGNSLSFSTYLGGDDKDEGRAIAVDSAGDIYLTGETFSSDFPLSNPLQAANLGQSDAFVTKISGSALEYSTYLGGGESDFAYGLALDNNGHAYVVGNTDSINFPGSSIGNSPLGHTDLFVVKIEDDGDQVIPPPDIELGGSYKEVSPLQAGPDEELVYTIGLHNSGANDALVTVTDDLPGEVAYVPNSVTGGGVYDAGTITWSDITVPAGDDVLLTFAAMPTSVTEAVVVVNTAVIAPSGADPLERSASVLLTPETVVEDVIPPIVTGLTIDDQDVIVDPDVTLHLTAIDNVGVEEMYLKEWALETDPFPHWQEVQSSGWVPYEATYPWTLEATSGTHFIIAWVADAAGNWSLPTLNAGDYASLLLPGETVSQHGMVPYMVYFEADVTVTATLTPTLGDADLYVWYPDSHLLPDQKSVNGGTAVDSVNFVTPQAGPYLFLVYGYTDATYDLNITPGGGLQANVTNSLSQIAMPSEQASAKAELTTEPVLTQSGLDPLGIAEPPQIFNVYLPIIAANQP